MNCLKNPRLGSASLFAGSFLLSAVVVLGLSGCDTQTPGSADKSSDNPVTPAEPDGHAHAHPSEGPHHGDLVELGAEEFHAEVVHGEAGAVTVYILDSAAKTAVPIDATELMINVVHDGNAEQFTLVADRDSSDPEGKSSRFTITDNDLAADLDHHDTTAKLAVTINGKSYSGRIIHQHDADHDHAHGDHKD